jgi:hypothetical protein
MKARVLGKSRERARKYMKPRDRKCERLHPKAGIAGDAVESLLTIDVSSFLGTQFPSGGQLGPKHIKVPELRTTATHTGHRHSDGGFEKFHAKTA